MYIASPFRPVINGTAKKTTYELFLNMDNVTTRIGRIAGYYNAGKAPSTDYFRQIGFFPNVMYRL